MFASSAFAACGLVGLRLRFLTRLRPFEMTGCASFGMADCVCVVASSDLLLSASPLFSSTFPSCHFERPSLSFQAQAGNLCCCLWLGELEISHLTA